MNVVAFQVMVSGDGPYAVEITDQRNGEFARAEAPDLWTALRMAVPYMAAAADPDPFSGLAERGSLLSVPEEPEEDHPAGVGPYGF